MKYQTSCYKFFELPDALNAQRKPNAAEFKVTVSDICNKLAYFECSTRASNLICSRHSRGWPSEFPVTFQGLDRPRSCPSLSKCYAWQCFCDFSISVLDRYKTASWRLSLDPQLTQAT